MAVSVWTNNAKRRMFELLPKVKINGKVVGYYKTTWTVKPPHFTVKEWRGACHIIMDKMIAENAFTKKVPKSSSAINMLIQHAIAPQNNILFRKSRSSLRFAAYYAGFMEMTDIVYLEDKAREKHGIRVDIEGDI